MCIWLVMLVRTLQGRILLLMGVILLARGSVGWVWIPICLGFKTYKKILDMALGAICW